MNLSTSDRTELLLKKNGFRLNDTGHIDYPRDGQHYFNQNLLLSLYINGALVRDGQRYMVYKQVPTYMPIPVAA